MPYHYYIDVEMSMTGLVKQLTLTKVFKYHSFLNPE
jgi:hypothetical protein